MLLRFSNMRLPKFLNINTIQRCRLSQNPIESRAEALKKKYKKPQFLDDYHCVYEMKYIRHLKLINRSQIYLTSLATLMALGSLYGYETKKIESVSSILVANGFMYFTMGMLFLVSKQSSRFVGRMYISKDKERVVISHLSIVGKRKNIEVPLDKIQPFDSSDELKDVFIKLRFTNVKDFMYISMGLAKIHDKENFLKILGLR
jgi:hypothetical protein